MLMLYFISPMDVLAQDLEAQVVSPFLGLNLAFDTWRQLHTWEGVDQNMLHDAWWNLQPMGTGTSNDLLPMGLDGDSYQVIPSPTESAKWRPTLFHTFPQILCFVVVALWFWQLKLGEVSTRPPAHLNQLQGEARGRLLVPQNWVPWFITETYQVL